MDLPMIYQYDLVELGLAPLQLLAGDPRHPQHPCHQFHVHLREEEVLVRSVLLGLLKLLHDAVAGPEEVLEPLLFLHTVQIPHTHRHATSTPTLTAINCSKSYVLPAALHCVATLPSVTWNGCAP